MSPRSLVFRLGAARVAWLAGALAALLVVGGLGYAYLVGVDTDGDGFTDMVERSGWQTIQGATYVTNPNRQDTDDDGLTDRQEAGEVIRSPDAGTVCQGLTDPTRADSDGDLLGDGVETLGWSSDAGERFETDPNVPDTDGDGLLDGWEAGIRAPSSPDEKTFALYSNPRKIDSDDDGLSDAEEADLSLNPFDVDTDGDQLIDYEEVNVRGTSAELADTDGDGLDDGYEIAAAKSEALDPLQVNVEADPDAYARDFAAGMLAGDAAPGDSIAWLAGNLVSGALSTVPVVGWAFGGIADIRDSIASAVRADWASAAYSAIGLVPTVGDSVAVPLKVAKFLTKHPELVDDVIQTVTSSAWIPQSVQINVITAAAPEAWPAVTKLTSTKIALELANRGVSLKKLGDALTRANHVDGVAAPFQPGVASAEVELIRIVANTSTERVESRVVASTAGCAAECARPARIVDVLADDIAHEAKVGYTMLTPAVEKQIRADAHLIESGLVERALALLRQF